MDNIISAILERRNSGYYITHEECNELRRNAKRLIKEQCGETVYMKNMMIIPYSNYYMVVNLDKEFFKEETKPYHYIVTSTRAKKVCEGRWVE